MTFYDSIGHAGQRIAESTPFVLIVGPIAGAMAAVWGPSFGVALVLLVFVMGWDWILGGQVGARRDHYLKALGVTDPLEREALGGFSFNVARHGVQSKLNIAVTCMLFGLLEAWGLPLIGNPVVVLADATLPATLEPDGRHAIIGTAVLMGVALQELTSAERNRRLLGGGEIPLLSGAISLLSRVVGRMVPDPEHTDADPTKVEPLAEWYRAELAHRAAPGRRHGDPATEDAPGAPT